MLDIIAQDEDTLAKAREHGIQPLVIGEDVTLAQTREQAKNAKTLLVIATQPSRELLEAPIDAVASLETSEKNDFMHHRRAGIDQVAAQILKEKNAAIILDLHALRTSKNRSQTLGRMQQNARIATKLGVPLLLASFAHKPEELPTTHDHQAFWRAMGVDEKAIADSQEAFAALVEQARYRASDAYIAEGVSKTE